MLLRGCLDLISKQISWQRPFFVIRSQTLCYSTDSSLPTKPKRHRNPWLFFFVENFPQAQADNPSSSSSKIFSLLSTKWKSLGADAQKRYRKMAEDDKNRYETELQAYKASLTPEKELAIAEEKQKSKLKKAQLTEKKKLKALGIPKKPPNAYVLYSSDFLRRKAQELPKGEKFTLKGQAWEVSESWAKISAEDKAKWEELASAKAKEFKKKIVEWENEMTSKGYLEIKDKKK